ncbi:glycosyltransferase 61 family protein [Pseudomonas guariconensis]|uniref:glycosyltransferase 61 family protein n=1 Tax=Pseudomonas guariconensis TaxID=1288410 RepID=UPI002B060BB0|nr:glycosyltransferase 61 family protein [Pseudomonas guariconensis]
MESEVSAFSQLDSHHRRHWTLAAYKYIARKRLARQVDISLKSIAEKSWDIAPGCLSFSPPAIALPGQLERVTGWEEKRFYPYEHPARTMAGLGEVVQGPTRGYLLKNVWLIDGVLYKGRANFWLSQRPRAFPRVVVEHEIDRGAIYCSVNGNTWFGNWMVEDCVTYSLAADEGVPVTVGPSARFPIYTQAPPYEEWLGMKPRRLSGAFFHELVLFDDFCNNRNKYLRFRAMGDKLLSRVSYQPHPGVFLLRGGDGDLRLLRNELELAEHLRRTRGFHVVDPLKSDVPSIVAACAGAQVVIGVEGSQLVHGVNVLQPGGALLALQPPNRFVSYYKYHTDRDSQHFAYVVGTPEGDGFRIDIEEVERTLDLIPAP